VSESTFTPGQTLAKAPIFSGLTESELSFLAQRAVWRHYATGESIFGEGEPCSGLYVVESGHVRIFKSSANGREQVLSIDGPGGSIAELPVFDGGSYPASATAIDDATLLFVSKQDFQALCLAHPQVALKVLRVVGARLRQLVGIIEELSFTTVRHRLASFLFRLSQNEGKRSGKGVEITLPTSNQEGQCKTDFVNCRKYPFSSRCCYLGHVHRHEFPFRCGPNGDQRLFSCESLVHIRPRPLGLTDERPFHAHQMPGESTMIRGELTCVYKRFFVSNLTRIIRCEAMTMRPLGLAGNRTQCA